MARAVNPGTYVAKLGGQIVVYETEGGALCAAVPCQVCEGEFTGKTMKHTMTMVKKDGTIQTKTCDTIKEVFGWDGVDPFWLMDADLSDKAFSITVEDEQGQDGNTYSKVQWLNPLGGGPGMKMPQPANRQSVLAKYGSKFRALAGGAAVKPAAPSKPAPSAPTKPAPAVFKPIPDGPTATMEEAWEECCKNNPGNEEPTWHAVMGAMFPNKTNSDLGPHDWGKLKQKFADNVPS